LPRPPTNQLWLFPVPARPAGRCSSNRPWSRRASACLSYM
jgi:hypothetical protein